MIAVVVAATLWILVVVNGRRLVGPRSERSLLWAALFTAIALTANIDSVHLRIDELVGQPNFATLIEHVAEVIGIGFYAAIFGAVAAAAVGRQPSHSRLKWPAATAVIVLLIALFYAADTRTESTHFAADYGNQVPILLFWLVTLGYLAWLAIQLLVLTTKYRHAVTNKAMRVAFVLVAGGSLALLPFCATKLLVVLSHSIPTGIADGANTLAGAFLALAIIGYGIGLSVPSLAALATRTVRGITDRSLHRQLRPMWRALTTAAPSVVLNSRPIRQSPAARLSGRVVEIRDAQLVLSVKESAVLIDAAGMAPEAREAAQTSAAIRGAAVHVPSDTDRPERFFVDGRSTITDEARYLVRVWRTMLQQQGQGDRTHSDVSGRAARIVSALLAPKVVASVVNLAAGLKADPGLSGLGWGVAALAVAPLVPSAMFQLAKRRIAQGGPADDSVRAARVFPLVAAAAATCAGVAVLYGFDAPSLTVATCTGMAAGLLILMTARVATNVSAHVSIAAGAVVWSTLMLSWWWLLAVAALVAVAWSRVRLREHSLVQVIWAVPIGAVTSAIALIAAGFSGA